MPSIISAFLTDGFELPVDGLAVVRRTLDLIDFTYFCCVLQFADAGNHGRSIA
jgi:hypothetical protein